MLFLLLPLFSDINIYLLFLIFLVTFCYPGDMISAGGGCESAAITAASTAWGKYRDLLPILSSKSVASKTKGKVYDTYVRSPML